MSPAAGGPTLIWPPCSCFGWRTAAIALWCGLTCQTAVCVRTNTCSGCFFYQAAVDWQAWDEGQDTQIPVSISCHHLTVIGGSMTHGLPDNALLCVCAHVYLAPYLCQCVWMCGVKAGSGGTQLFFHAVTVATIVTVTVRLKGEVCAFTAEVFY